jgi:murein DD-endopeptidase MepM/ murein hydrolase activator NlpD
MRRSAIGVLLAVGLLTAGCSTGPSTGPAPATSPGTPPVSSAPASTAPVRTVAPLPTPTRTPSPQPSRKPSPKPTMTLDHRNRFYTSDKTEYASPWYVGRHRIMVEYGCTRAPYYAPDPRCPNREGFHHGVDIAMPCGTEIMAGVSGRVIDPNTPGTPGPAYGSTAFRIRTRNGQDILIGHARKVFVAPGDRVRRGQRIALAGARGAPDGCHLHLEVRPAGGGVSSAVSPMTVAGLRG